MNKKVRTSKINQYLFFNVAGMSQEKLFDMAKYRISEILCNIFFQAAVSALFWQSQFCTSKKILE
jgi:hypothetical protein